MNKTRRMIMGLLGWTTIVSILHLRLNLDWSALFNDRLPRDKRKLNVAYIPVT